MPRSAKNQVKLTQRYAEKTVFESGKEAFVYDNELPGFALRVQASGRRVWMYRDGNKKITIALINEINEAAARARVIDLRQAKRVGRDLHEEEQARITAQKKAEAGKLLTAGYCFEKFISSPKAFEGRTEAYRSRSLRLLRDYVLTHASEMEKPLSEIAYTQMMRFVQSVPEKNWASRQKLINAIQQTYKFFRHDLDEIVPAYGHLATPSFDELHPVSRRREDKLTIEQLKIVYAAAEDMAEQNIWHSAFFKFLILSARRTGTIRAMRWENLILRPNDEKPPHWRIPAEFNRKGRGAGTGRVQELPLTPRMIALLEEIPNAGPYVFGGGLIRVATGSKTINKIREASGIQTDQDGNPWTLHGIRRSMASSRLGATQKQIVDLVQGRRPNQGADANYFQGEYLEEQMELLVKWDKMLFPTY